MRNKLTITLVSILTLVLISLFAGLQGSSADAMPDTSQTLPSQTTAGSITFNVNATGTAINPYVLGTNLPAWLGSWRTQDNTFINRTKAANLTLIRIPGGSWSNYYEWDNCEINNVCPWDWGALKPTDFIDFIQATNTAAIYTVNQNGTSKEAAALVAFFNGSVSDNRTIGVDVNGKNWGTVGQWAQLRSDHGNANPINIKYYEIGNEIYGGKPGLGKDCLDWGWEDVWTCDGTEYANGLGNHEGFIAFRNAMRFVDPTIQVGAVGVTYGNSPDWWINYNNWGNEVIAAAGSQMDFYVIHQYALNDPTSYTDVLAQPQGTWQAIKADIDTSFDQHANGRRVPIAVTEYNLFAIQDNDNGQWMTQAVNMLFMGDTIGQMMTHGFDIANQWDLANGQAWNGTDYGLLNADSFARSPQYYVYPLWRKFGAELLPVSSSHNATSQLSVYAGRIDPWTVSVMAINKTGSAIQTTIQMQGAPATLVGGTADVAKASALNSQTITFNGVSNPNDSLSNAPSTNLGVIANPLSYTFQPYSITLLKLQIDAFEPTDWVYLPSITK
jgi:alpha-L-arabinofuranosidase